jgi:hypothetical protein
MAGAEFWRFHLLRTRALVLQIPDAVNTIAFGVIGIWHVTLTPAVMEPAPARAEARRPKAAHDSNFGSARLDGKDLRPEPIEQRNLQLNKHIAEPREVVFRYCNGAALKASSGSLSVEIEQLRQAPQADRWRVQARALPSIRPNVQTRMIVRQVGVFDRSGRFFADASKIASCARFMGISLGRLDASKAKRCLRRGAPTGAVGGPRLLEIDPAVALTVRPPGRMPVSEMMWNGASRPASCF